MAKADDYEEVGVVPAELPTWEECKKKDKAGVPLNTLEHFIYDYSPVSGLEDEEFRKDLAELVEYLVGLGRQT